MGGAVVLEAAKAHLHALGQIFRDLEVAAMDHDVVDAWLELACATERQASGMKLALAPMVLRRASWKEEGYRSEAAWWADRTRTTVPDAVGQLTTAKRLSGLPATAEAVRAGALSAVEARSVAAAAEADPAWEAELLGAAGSVRSSDLVHSARALSQAAKAARPGHRESLHKRRFLRFWTDEEGMVRMSAGLTPDEGAELFAAVRSRAYHVADEARQAGLGAEDQAAYDADALVGLALGVERRATFEGPVGTSRPRPRVFVHVDLPALLRGHAGPGELCELAGFGPVPVSVARMWIGDSELSVVFKDGVDISRVRNLGRTISAATEAALVARDRTCVVPGCNVSIDLENDHYVIPFCEGGATELWNMARICRFHHKLKTYDGFVLRGGPGRWEWIGPSDVADPAARAGP